jgi:TIR domain
MKSALQIQPDPKTITPGKVMTSVNFTYDAFISYSNSQDYRQIARALQRDLHAFARPWNRLRAMRTYRDETHITPAANLWEAIEKALSASRCFVLLASPEAAESPWVQRELEWWLAHHGSDRLFLCVVGGSIEFERASLTLDKARTDCLPVDIADRLPASPFYVDLRPCVRDPKRQSMTDETFRTGIQKLSAAIQERPLDELAGEDIWQQRLRTRVRNGVIAALTVFAVAAAWSAVLAFNASKESRRQERLALVGQGGALASASALAARLGDGTNAVLYASAARGRLGQANRPTEIAESAPADGTSQQQVEFSLYEAQSLPVLVASFDLPPSLLPVLDFDAKRRRLYVMGKAGLQMLEPFRHPGLIKLASLTDPEIGSIAADPTSGRVAALTSTGILMVDPDEPEKAPVSVTPRTSFNALNALVFAPHSGDLLAVAGASYTVFRAGKSWEPARIVDKRAALGGARDVVHLVTAREAEIALVVSRKSSSLLIDLTKANVETEIGGESGTFTIDGALRQRR